MKFSDLKKKLPSLRVGVLVIAAFALVGLMMMPEMGKNFGVGIARAQSGYSNSYINTGSNYNLMPPPEPEEEDEHATDGQGLLSVWEDEEYYEDEDE
jgi:hypothetical protein